MKEKRWTTNEFLDGILIDGPTRESYERLKVAVKDFEREVWFNGLQDWINAESQRGMADSKTVWDHLLGEDCVEMLTYAIAARVMITLQRRGIFLSVVVAEHGTENSMGIQGLHATEAEAMELLQVAQDQWKAGRRPTGSSSVGLAGLMGNLQEE
jgi:hypothetical protein